MACVRGAHAAFGRNSGSRQLRTGPRKTSQDVCDLQCQGGGGLKQGATIRNLIAWPAMAARGPVMRTVLARARASPAQMSASFAPNRSCGSFLTDALQGQQLRRGRDVRGGLQQQGGTLAGTVATRSA